jgi:putative serine protease PepD
MRKLSRWVPVIGGAIAGGIIALVIASTGNHSSTKSVTTTVVQSNGATSEPTSFARSGSSGMSINQIYQQDGPGVVDILVKSKSSGASSNSLFGGGSSVEEGEGAGVVYNDQGYILTDEHVVANAVKVVVTFQNGTKVPAKVIGSDASSDVGVIKVDVPSSELHPIKFANSDTAQVGDPVVAIGSPFSLPETVTSGIVSQTQRTIQAPNGYFIPDAVQTDAAINPGNSGGPLLNADGEVLGLNDQIETDSQNSATGEGQNAGIGFATPSNEDQRIAAQLIAGKTVQHAFLGIATSQPTGANLLSTQKSTGVTITKVETQGPAAKAGLEVDDVITKINGVTVTSYDQLISVIARYDPGQTVTLTILRAGQTKQVKVTFSNRPPGNAN